MNKKVLAAGHGKYIKNRGRMTKIILKFPLFHL